MRHGPIRFPLPVLVRTVVFRSRPPRGITFGAARK